MIHQSVIVFQIKYLRVVKDTIKGGDEELIKSKYQKQRSVSQ